MNSQDLSLSYDDVLLKPRKSLVESRDDVILDTSLTNSLPLEIPLVSSPMDTVTEQEMAIAVAQKGGVGVVHRFMKVKEQASHVDTVSRQGLKVGAAVGIDEDYCQRADYVVAHGADFIVVDVAHGHMKRTIDAVRELNTFLPNVPVIAGNVATEEGVRDLALAGADAVKVGVGPGSHCTTREVTGVGVPQFTAVQRCSKEAEKHDVHIIADGGIRSSGDAAKALMAGASTVMMGSFFMGTDESPGQIHEKEDGTRVKLTRGMASEEAGRSRSDKKNNVDAEEGVDAITEYKGSIKPHIDEFTAGLRSSLSYCGSHTIEGGQRNAEFVRVTPSVQHRNGEHDGF